MKRLTRPDGTASAQSQAEEHPVTSFEESPRLPDLIQESWRSLQDFENISNI